MPVESSKEILNLEAERSSAKMRRVSQNMSSPIRNEESWNGQKKTVLKFVDLRTSNSHKCDQIRISSEIKELLHPKAEKSKATADADGVSESMQSPGKSDREQNKLSAESSKEVLNLDSERSNATTQAVFNNMLPLEKIQENWNRQKSTALALIDLHASNSHKCDQIRISSETFMPQSRKEVLRLKAETSKATTETVGVSKSMLPQENSKREESTLSGESCKGDLNRKTERSSSTIQTVSKYVLSPERSEEPWNHPKSAVLALMDLQTGYSHKYDHRSLSSEGSERILKVKPESSKAKIDVIGHCKSMLTPEKLTGSGNKKTSSKSRVNSNEDDNKVLYSGLCCGYCIRPLSRHYCTSNIYNLVCMGTYPNNEKGRKPEILKENNYSKYYTHWCDIPKGTIQAVIKTYCNLCTETFMDIFAFECHIKLQHKLNLIAICHNCNKSRSNFESHVNSLLRRRRKK